MFNKNLENPDQCFYALRAIVLSYRSSSVQTRLPALAPPPQNSLSASQHSQAKTPLRGKTFFTSLVARGEQQSLFFRLEEPMFLPLMKSIVAKQRVMVAGLVRELVLWHKAMTAAQKFKEPRLQQRGFYGFCL